MSNNINNQFNNNFFLYNNNNNINNNNLKSMKYQLVTHDNLFNSNIKSLPQFNFQINNSEPNHFFNKRNILSEDEDYNKYKEEKHKEIMNNQKKQRFLQNFRKKIEEFKNNKANYPIDDNSEVFIDDYIKKIKEIYQDQYSYYDYIEENGSYNFSQCPFCRYPAVFILDRVLCINKCFMTNVGKNSFDNNYTLSNFIEQYKDYYSNHLNCKSDLTTLYIDMESKCAEFLCLKCQKNYLNLDNLEEI